MDLVPLVPVVSNGQLIEVKVLSGGIGFEQGDTIDVLIDGEEVEFSAKIQSWQINLFQKHFNKITMMMDLLQVH